MGGGGEGAGFGGSVRGESAVEARLAGGDGGAGVPSPYGKQQQEEGAIVRSGGLMRLFIELAGRVGYR